MKLRLNSIGLGALLLLGSLLLPGFAQEKSADISKPSRSYWGTTVTVFAVEKTRNYTDLLGREMTAKPGSSIIVVRLKFTMPGSTLKFENCRLNGTFDATLKQMTVRSPAGSQETLNIYFEIPDGTAILTFQLDNLSFDLQSFGMK